jgi:hypothetical protein
MQGFSTKGQTFFLLRSAKGQTFLQSNIGCKVSTLRDRPFFTQGGAGAWAENGEVEKWIQVFSAKGRTFLYSTKRQAEHLLRLPKIGSITNLSV